MTVNSSQYKRRKINMSADIIGGGGGGTKFINSYEGDSSIKSHLNGSKGVSAKCYCL